MFYFSLDMKRILMIKCIPLFFLLCLATAEAQYRHSFPNACYRLVMDREQRNLVLPTLGRGEFPAADLVVGFPNPNEVREINTPLDVYGNIIIVNNGQLRFNDVEVNLAGNIVVVDNGKLLINGGLFRVQQSHHFERVALVSNKATLWFAGARLLTSNFSFGIALTDTALLRMDGTIIANGVLQTMAGDRAAVECNASGPIGELVSFGNARATFTDCNGILPWINVNANANVEMSFPQGTAVNEFAYPDSARTATGVTTSMRLKNCTQTVWGLLTESGSRARITNSNLFAGGVIFSADSLVTVGNLLNNATLTGYQFPAADRDVQFDKTTVRSWHLFPVGRSNVMITNSIFGEINAMGASQTLVANSMCDGTGGQSVTIERARLTYLQSQISTDVIARDQSQQVFYLSNIPSRPINALGGSSIGLLNTSFSSLPLVDNVSAALIGSIDEPSRGFVGEILPIFGSARVIAGKDIPVYLDQYFLEYHLEAFPDNKFRIGERSIKEKYRDTLGVWSTGGLLPGNYVLVLNIVFNTGDTISVSRQVILQNPPVSVEAFADGESFELLSYPNPVRLSVSNEVHIQFNGVKSAHDGRLLVTDVLGRTVHNTYLADNEILQGSVSVSTEKLRPGLYMVHLRIGNTQHTKSFAVIQ